MVFRYRTQSPTARFRTFFSRRADQETLRHVDPIVIGGCARSGTTLLLSALSSHPQIAAIPIETQSLCPTAYDPHPNWESDFDTTTLHQHLAKLKIDSSNCRYWCEKTPKNILFFERILSYLGPTARLFNVVRDGRDVVCSVHPDDPSNFWVSPQRWVQEVEAGMAFENHPQVLTLRYEDFVSRFREMTRTICDFLNLDSSDQIELYPSFATVKKSNAWFSPAHAPTTARIGRWRSASTRNRIDELLADENAVNLLRHYNYL
jgi:hypothetical protein